MQSVTVLGEVLMKRCLLLSSSVTVGLVQILMFRQYFPFLTVAEKLYRFMMVG